MPEKEGYGSMKTNETFNTDPGETLFGDMENMHETDCPAYQNGMGATCTCNKMQDMQESE